MPTPTQSQAAKTVMEASNDPGWGMFVWLAVTTGTTASGLCALRWDDIDLDSGVLTIRDHRMALDPRTVPLLRAYLAHCAARAAINGIERQADPYVFSPAPDGGTAPDLEEMAERYTLMCEQLGFDADLAHLPHYSANELVAAGVDLLNLHWRLQRGLSRIQRRPKVTPAP